MPMDASRRAFMLGAGCAGWGLTGGLHSALAAIDPATMKADLAPGYKPVDKDEKGFWQQVVELEEDVKRSNFRMTDKPLNDYMTSLCCSLSRDFCPDMRVYIIRTPYFNASMYPNGMMQVWTGLLLRVKSEAQLSAVIGHEIGHYLRRHMIAQYRSIRSKTSGYMFLAPVLAVATGGLANVAAEFALLGSIFSFSREHEREADMFGLQLMERSGLEPREASKVWDQLLKERDAKFKARNVKKPPEPVFFATHPAPADRMADLAAAAEKLVKKSGKSYDEGRDRFIDIIKPYRPQFLADQIKLNDFGGSLFLVDSLIGEGWDGDVFFQKGELYRMRHAAGDLVEAMSWYDKALAIADAPADAWRGKGLVLLKLDKKEEGKTALKKYLELKPSAVDRAMIEHSLQ
jgi:beta-barrel assembly-enhancing protease